MKTIWTILSVLSVINLIGLAGFTGWLITSDRLDPSRLRSLRELMSETLTDQHAREEADQSQKAADAQAAILAAKAAKPPMTAAEKLQARLEAGEVDTQRIKSLRAEVSALQQTLREAQAKVDAQRADLAQERAAFEAMRKEVQDKDGDAQFKKSLGVLEGMDAKAATATIKQLLASEISAGPAANQTSIPAAKPAQAGMALAYLNAMAEKRRSEILASIAKDDPKLAADLLERLRTYGVTPRVAEATK